MKNIKRFFDWMDKKTKRIDIICLKIVGLLVATAFFADFVIEANKEYIPENVYTHSKLIITVIVIIAICILPLLFIGIRLLIAVKKGMHNIRKCDDVLFDKIDYFLDYWRNEDATCKKRISIINLYYKDGGKVDELVKNKEIVRLYARKSFLSVRMSFTQDIMTCFYALVLSILASAVFQLMQSNAFLTTLFGLLLIFTIFFSLLFIKYCKRGENGFYTYHIEEYELKLLSKKIEKLESSLQTDEIGEMVLITQQTVLKDLISKKRKLKRKKSKKSIVKDIETIETLNLSLKFCDKYKLHEISFDKNTGYIAYSLDEVGEEKGFATDSFKILYDIIEKNYHIVERNTEYIVGGNA